HRSGVGIGTGEAVAEKAALAEGGDDALSDAGILDQGSRHETAETDEAGIERLWTIRDHVRPYGRMHAVSADHEIALGSRTIGKMGDDGSVGAILDPRKPLFEEQLDIFAPGLVDERLQQRGTAHVDGRLAETLLHVPVDGRNGCARLGEKVE